MKRNESENTIESVERLIERCLRDDVEKDWKIDDSKMIDDYKDVEGWLMKLMPWSHIYNLLMTQVKACDSWQFL